MGRAARRASSAIAAATLVVATLRARSHDVRETEERVFRACNGAPDEIHVPAWVVMQSGSLGAVFVTAGVLARQNHRRTAVASAVAGTAVWGAAKLIKPLVGRGRPDHHLSGVVVRGQPQTGLGYPSGHAAVATTLAHVATHGAPPPVRLAAGAIALVTGGARMYVGAHLPLDVMGGLAIGVLSGRLAEQILART